MKRKHHYNDDDFENGMLRDGKTYRAGSVMFMDSHRTSHRPHRDDRARGMQRMIDGNPAKIIDASGDRLGLHRPGFRVMDFDDEIARAAIADAHEKYLDDLTSAWKHLGDTRDAVGEGAEGSACTVKNAEYAAYVGGPGHIKNGVCVPDDELGDDGDDDANDYEDHAPRRAADAASVRKLQAVHDQELDAIYNQLDQELSQAYRNNK
jgi:hypothetical protein